MNNKILVAKFLSTHGLKGGIKIQSFVDKFEKLIEKNLSDNNENQYKISIKAFNGKIFICNINGINNVDQARKLINLNLYIDRNEIIEDNEILISDVINFDVYLVKNNSYYGKVIDWGDYGSGSILEIEIKNKKIEAYLFNYENFPEIDVEKKIIFLDIKT